MTKRGGWTGEKQQSLNSIRLEDFPENEDLASSYFDWEYDDYRGDNDEDEGTVVMKKADFLAEEDFLERSLKLLDNEPSEELEDFTLKLDSSYFDKSEEELLAEAADSIVSEPEDNSMAARKSTSVKTSSGRSSSERSSSGRSSSDSFKKSSSSARASGRSQSTSNKDTAQTGTSISVARLFADEEDALESASRTSSAKSAQTSSRKSSAGPAKASARTSRIKEETNADIKESKVVADSENTRKPKAQSPSQARRTSQSPSQVRRTTQAAGSDSGRSSGESGSSRNTSSRSTSSRNASASGSRSSGRSSSGGSSARTSSSRRKEKKKTPIGLRVAKFFIFLLLWVAVAVVCYKGYQFAYDIFYDVPIDSTDISKIEVTLTGKETDDEVGQILLDNGLIDDLKIYGYRCKLYKAEYRSGTFKLSRSFNTEKIVNILSGYSYADGRMEEEETEAESESLEDDQGEGQEDGEGGQNDGEGGQNDGEGGQNDGEGDN